VSSVLAKSFTDSGSSAVPFDLHAILPGLHDGLLNLRAALAKDHLHTTASRFAPPAVDALQTRAQGARPAARFLRFARDIQPQEAEFRERWSRFIEELAASGIFRSFTEIFSAVS
jgi:hypothetical protein